MKKLIATVLTILSCGAAYALPLGNPSEASLLCDGMFIEGTHYDFCQAGVSWCDAFSLRVGYYGDFVFDRHLEVDDANRGDDIEDTKIFTNAAYVAANFWDVLDIFATFGGTNFYINTNAFSFGGPNSQRFDLETETDFSWSVGLRLTFWECGCTSFGAEAQYFYTKPHITRVTVAETNSIYPDNYIHLKYQEWQLGFGVSHRIWNLVPYFGAKFSGVKADFGDANLSIFDPGTESTITIVLHRLENRFEGGFVLGVSLVDCERMALTVEARFPDEKAIYVNGQIRF